MNVMPRPDTFSAPQKPVDHPPLKSGRIGVLLLNLGTPEAHGLLVDAALPQGIPVRPPGDRDAAPVVVAGAQPRSSCRRGPKRKGRDYDTIWNNERDEGPLKTITRSAGGAARGPSQGRAPATRVSVDWAMRYGNPAIARAPAGAARRGLRPHPARAALSAIRGRDLGDRLRPRLPRPHGHALAADGPRLAALSRRSGLYRRARVVDEARRSRELPFEPEVILVSFHGVPKEYLLKGDPYHCHCVKTWRLHARRLRLAGRALPHELPVALRPGRVAAALHGRDRQGRWPRAASSAWPSWRPASRPIAWRPWRSSTARTAHIFERARRRGLRLSAVPQRRRRGHAGHPAHRRARAARLDLSAVRATPELVPAG